MKKSKQIISSVIAAALAAGLATSASAEGMLTFEEAEALGIECGEPLLGKTHDELIAEGWLLFGETDSLDSLSRATVSGVLGYVSASGTQNVYSTSTGSTIAGTVKQKDIVYVTTANIGSSRAYIQFKSGSSSLSGYVATSAINTPSYSWTKPINSGSISQWYWSSHTGYDIEAPSGTSVVAVNAGSAEFKTATALSGGTTKLVEYGNYIMLTTTANSTTKKAVYAHLSSFNGFTASSLASDASYAGAITRTVIGTKSSVAKGANLGGVGSTGKSTDNHLHFEVNTAAAGKEDPFGYVVFPAMQQS